MKYCSRNNPLSFLSLVWYIAPVKKSKQNSSSLEACHTYVWFSCQYSTCVDTYTSEDLHGTWKLNSGKGDSYWKSPFSGSMLNVLYLSKLSPQAVSKAEILTRDDSVVDDAGWYLAKWLSYQMQQFFGHGKKTYQQRVLQKAFEVLICWTQIQYAISFYQKTLMTPPLLWTWQAWPFSMVSVVILPHWQTRHNSDLHKTCAAWRGKGREDMHWKY